MALTTQVRRQALTFTLSGSGWATPQEVPRLGYSGTLTRAILRMGVGGTSTTGEIRVWHGSGYTSATVPSAVPDNDLVYEETGITHSASATDSSLDRDIQDVVDDAASYDKRLTGHSVWVSIKGDNAGTFYLSLHAKDVT